MYGGQYVVVVVMSWCGRDYRATRQHWSIIAHCHCLNPSFTDQLSLSPLLFAIMTDNTYEFQMGSRPIQASVSTAAACSAADQPVQPAKTDRRIHAADGSRAE